MANFKNHLWTRKNTIRNLLHPIREPTIKTEKIILTFYLKVTKIVKQIEIKTKIRVILKLVMTQPLKNLRKSKT
jgi:hypothetical protein